MNKKEMFEAHEEIIHQVARVTDRDFTTILKYVSKEILEILQKVERIPPTTRPDRN